MDSMCRASKCERILVNQIIESEGFAQYFAFAISLYGRNWFSAGRWQTKEFETTFRRHAITT